ncbi:MAG: prolyl oligopeptidase family serine peptidase [Myxococcota bacterium]
MRLLRMLLAGALMVVPVLATGAGVLHAGKVGVKGWPAGVRDIRFTSPADNSRQPALFYVPPGRSQKRPLLVALHTWSRNYLQPTGEAYADWCVEKGWIFVHPNYRGANVRPAATGSELVVADILAAVEYARAHANVDESRIYLVGYSGGGHASLLMAGRAPEIWAGVSAWAPITDLKAWYWQTKDGAFRHYAEHIRKSCGGVPWGNTRAARECRKRSPITYLHNAVGVPLDINAGIQDGHTGSVPTSHALDAYNLLANEEDRLTPQQVRTIVDKAVIPRELGLPFSDPLFGTNKILFRRQSGHVRITISDGAHQIKREAALQWLSQQRKVQGATTRPRR